VSTQNFKPENGQSDGSWRNERSMRNNQTRSSPSHNHDSVAPRQHPLICTGAGPMHPVHGQPMSLAIKVIPRNEVTFSPFSRAFSYFLLRIWYMFCESKCREESNLGLYTSSGLAKRMPLRSADFRQILPDVFF